MDFFLPDSIPPNSLMIENKTGNLEDEMEEGQFPLTLRAKHLFKALLKTSAFPRFCLEFREGQSFTYVSLVHHSKSCCQSFGRGLYFAFCFCVFFFPLSSFKSDLSILRSIGCSVPKPALHSHFLGHSSSVMFLASPNCLL